MRLARFLSSGKKIEGMEENGQLLDSGGNAYSPEDVTWLPPANPSKIIGFVLNYRDHANELGLNVTEDPVIFLKPPSSLIGNKEEIVYPEGIKFMHYEGELCVIIGSTARKVSASRSLEYVKGFTIANDVTVRDFITNTFRPPVKAKGFDTFCPVGPYLVTPDQAGDISHLKIRTLVNGQLRQEGTTADLMHPVPEMIEYLSNFMTLFPEDMILTGTPKGISPIHPGDKVEIEIENLGRLENPVVAKKQVK
jgi:5-oxopent-3-ene-1,2,5-tricarboxylate decarboxylase / 2-hydroxyhepta-2,4-diene-1,7-dioate isomerase